MLGNMLDKHTCDVVHTALENFLNSFLGPLPMISVILVRDKFLQCFSPQTKIHLSVFRTGEHVSLQGTAVLTPLFQVLLTPLRVKGYNEQGRQMLV